MRAHEFISEDQARPTKRQKQSSRGMNIFWDKDRNNSDYTLNRVMMAAASTDGTFVPDIDSHSWIANDRSAHPYTKQEQDMLKKAYQAVGASHKDLNKGNMNSMELETTNKISPVKSFKGYPR